MALAVWRESGKLATATLSRAGRLATFRADSLLPADRASQDFMSTHAANLATASPGFGPLELPSRLKVLLVAEREHAGDWLAEAFAADDAAQIEPDEVVGVGAALARLRDEAYDAVLACHEPGALEALDLVEAIRTGGGDEPVIILGRQAPQTFDALCYEAGADDYCCVADTTVRGLLWKLARAMRRFHLVKENRRLVQAERQRLQQEHGEAQRLLEQQRALICDLEELSGGKGLSAGQSASSAAVAFDLDKDGDDPFEIGPEAIAARPPLELPAALVNHYREMLRAYVIMGAGNLSDEMATLADMLAAANSSAQRTMQLHVQVLEELVQGLGNRSARHVMNRADLLVLEVMGHLADGYRRRYHERRAAA
jgi:DNA-binding response OmpR family regulator